MGVQDGGGGVSESSDEKRDAFEDWYSGGWEHPHGLERRGEGYALLATDNAWQVWCVAWEAAR